MSAQQSPRRSRLLPATFALVFAALSVGTIATSETLWQTPVAASARVAN